MMTQYPAAPNARRGAAWPLAQRHMDVIAGYARGLTAQQIADELGISEKSVLNRTINACKALNIQGARQPALVDYAYRHGHLTVDQPYHLKPLTPRLAQVLDCAARGLTSKAIATELGISDRTARTHRVRMQKALGVHTTARAVAVAWEAGLRGVAGEGSPS